MILTGYTIGTTLYGATADDLNIHYGITGLDWVYTNYNTSTGNTSRECLVHSCLYLGQNISEPGLITTNPPTYTFRKCVTTDITINLYTVMGTLPVMNIGTIFPQLNFNFIITPI